MSKFKTAESYAPRADAAYSLMPFNFKRIAPDLYRAVTLTGDQVVIDRDTLEKLVNKSLEPSSTAYKDLRTRGFLFDSLSTYLIEQASLRLRTRMAHVLHLTSLFMFVVSLRCDHSCPYCQVSRRNQAANKKFDMSEDTADKALQIVFASPSPYIKIEFQGGEPLINFDLIKYIVVRGKELNKIHNRDLEFVIATNLSLLNNEILEFCREHSVDISTSLDGPEDLHNANRPRPDKDSYQRTIDGIRRCREYLGRHKVSALMTTSPASLTRFRDIVDEYISQGFDGIFLRPLSPYGYAVKTKWAEKYSMPEWLEAYKDALDYILEINQSGHRFIEFYTALVVRRVMKPSYTGYVDLQHPTGAGLSALLFNYNGKVYSSDEARMLAEMGDDTLCVGHVGTDSYRDVMTSKSMQAQIGESFGYSASSCSQCAYLPYCGSEPARHHATQGDFMGNKNFSAFCERQMGVIGHIFDLLEVPTSRIILKKWAYDTP